MHIHDGTHTRIILTYMYACTHRTTTRTIPHFQQTYSAQKKDEPMIVKTTMHLMDAIVTSLSTERGLEVLRKIRLQNVILMGIWIR
jgi:hypothetical protein